MATIQQLNFHNQKMNDEKKRVALRIANGLKSDSSAIIAKRMMNPSFKGNVKNSTGSKNMPFFASLNEIDTPLEVKIARRGAVYPLNIVRNPFQQKPLPIETHNQEADSKDYNPNIVAPPFIPPYNNAYYSGGVLRNYKYAKKILNRRKVDIENQLRAEVGMPPIREPGVLIDELTSRKLELSFLLNFFSDVFTTGEFSKVSRLDINNLNRLVISVAPFLTQDELVDIERILVSSLETLDNMMYQRRRGVEPIDSERKKKDITAENEIRNGDILFVNLLKFIRQIIDADVKGRDTKEKITLAQTLAKELGVKGIKEVRVRMNDLLREQEERALKVSFGINPDEDTTTTVSPLSSGPTSASASERIQPTVTQVQEVPPQVQAVDTRKNDITQRTISAYVRNDIPELQAILREVAPERRANKFFNADASRTVLRNAIYRAIY